MKKRNLICGVVLILSVASTLHVEGQDNSLAPAVESNHSDSALKILSGMTQFIEAAPAFSVKGKLGGDLLLENGQLAEYGSTFTAVLSRPAKLYLFMNSRDGSETTTVFDGEAITVAASNDGRHIYDTMPQPGDVNESLDFIASQTGVPRQLNYILSNQITKVLNGVQTAFSLGKSTIGDVLCVHLVVRSETKDGQVWIERGDEPTPRRILITHRNKPGLLRFWIQFDEWVFSPEFPESTFKYTPPEDAIKFHYFSE